MIAFRSYIIAFFLVFASVSGFAAESHGEDTHSASAEDVAAHVEHGDDEHAEGGHHGLPPNAVPLFKIGPFWVTNSMIATWIVAALIILMSQLAAKDAKLIPSGMQNFWEWLVEELYGLFEGILGPDLVKRTFWFLATIFIFILATNWFGLIPGLGTIGWGAEDASGHFIVAKPLMRGVNADLNMTAAMALLFFVLWCIWAIQANGVKGFIEHIFALKGHGGGFMGLFLIGVFLLVGVIEVISISVRPVALMFRLYGNVFAGENILETVMHLGGLWLGWLIVLPFYMLELLVGLVQALVFALLTSVFTALMCVHEEGAH